MISALLMMFLLICLSIVSFLTVVCPSLTVGLAAPAEFSTSLLSTAYFLLLFTTIFYSGQRMFLLIAFGVAVHFKQHSSLTYQNLLGFALLHRLRTTDYGQRSSGSRKYGTTELRNNEIRVQRVQSNYELNTRAIATCSLVDLQPTGLLSVSEGLFMPKILQHYNNITIDYIWFCVNFFPIQNRNTFAAVFLVACYIIKFELTSNAHLLEKYIHSIYMNNGIYKMYLFPCYSGKRLLPSVRKITVVSSFAINQYF